jgi:N utilization substance protein A
MKMDNKEFKRAFDFIVEEKGIDAEKIIEAMGNGLAAAYKRETGEDADIRPEINPENGIIKIFKRMTVVEELENPDAELTVEEAREIKSDANLGDVLETEVTPEDFGRVAISVAKQVVLQKIREAERNNIMEEMREKQDEMMIGFLAMEDNRNYYVDLGKARGLLPKNELIPGETLKMGDSVKVYITKVEETTKGPSIKLSRKHYGFVKRLFELEIPEFGEGILLMHGVAREAGVRSKVAVSSVNPSVDAIGSCIGEKGRRIANIISVLNGEKVDLILYDENPEVFIANALSPAKNLNVSIIDEKEKEALVITDDENLSLAIGKKGINIKLASKLTRYKLNIKTLDKINEEINK